MKGKTESRGATKPPLTLWLSNAATASMALLLILSGLTFAEHDASILGLEHLDASWVYIATGCVGLASIVWRRARVSWLMLLTVCTLGRSVSLLVVGSPVVTDRLTEIRGAAAWWAFWILGAAPTICAQASEIVRGRIEV